MLFTAVNFSSSDSIAPGVSKKISFNNVQLNQIPSKFLIFARKPTSTTTTYDSNSFMVIRNTSINFANKSGLLSSATPVQLYDMSVRNGLQMNYYEFSGGGVSNNQDGVSEIVPTIGSILCIDPAIDLSIDAQYSNMSSGQYSMQFDIELYNQTSEAIMPTLYLLYVNSGLFVTENGISQQNTGLLSQEMVLDTKSKDAVMDKHTYESKVVGGSIENINAIHKHMKLNFHNATEKERMIDNEPGEFAPTMQKASGMSASGMPKRRIHKYAQ